MKTTAAAMTAKTADEMTCEKCRGSGTWEGWYGAEPCWRCTGKGYQTPADERRNRAYDAWIAAGKPRRAPAKAAPAAAQPAPRCTECECPEVGTDGLCEACAERRAA